MTSVVGVLCYAFSFADPLVNGNKAYPDDTPSSSFGTIIEYSCDPGYELDGAASIICREDGWSDVEPTCVILECPYEYFQSLVSRVYCIWKKCYNTTCI